MTLTFRFSGWSGGCLLAMVFVVTACADPRLSFDVKINGTPARLAMDTGAGVNLVLFAEAAETLGLAIAPPSPGAPKAGQVKVGWAEPVTLDWAGNNYPNTVFSVLDLPLPGDVQGLIGWPVFAKRVVTLRLAEKKVDIGDQVPRDARSWKARPIVAGSDTLRFKVGVDSRGRDSEVLIDTGDSSGITLSPMLWRQWRLAHPHLPHTLTAAFTPAKGLLVQEVIPVREITIGDLTLYHITVLGPEVMPVGPPEERVIATFGLATLQRLDVVTDGKAGIIFLQPRKDKPKNAFPLNRLGAVFVPDLNGSDDLIAHVAEGSPAALAGIRNGDQLLQIDDLDVTVWRADPSILPFTKYWERPSGTKLALTLKRNDEPLPVTVTLSDAYLVDLKRP